MEGDAAIRRDASRLLLLNLEETPDNIVFREGHPGRVAIHDSVESIQLPVRESAARPALQANTTVVEAPSFYTVLIAGGQLQIDGLHTRFYLYEIEVYPGFTVSPEEYRRRYAGFNLEYYRQKMKPEFFRAFVRGMGAIRGVEGLLDRPLEEYEYE